MWDIIRELVSDGHDPPAHHAVPRGGRPAREPDRRDRRRPRDRRGHLGRAQGEGRRRSCCRCASRTATGSARPPDAARRPRTPARRRSTRTPARAQHPGRHRGHGDADRGDPPPGRRGHPARGHRAAPTVARRRVPLAHRPRRRGRRGAAAPRATRRSSAGAAEGRSRHEHDRPPKALEPDLLARLGLVGPDEAEPAHVHPQARPAGVLDDPARDVRPAVRLRVRRARSSQILPPNICYVDFLMPGSSCRPRSSGALQTGVGLADDLQKGLIDRFSRCRWPARRCSRDAPPPTPRPCFQIFLMLIVALPGRLPVPRGLPRGAARVRA